MLHEELLTKIEQRLNGLQSTESELLIPVGISNRHVHLSAEDVQSLFGEGYQLTKMKDLKQKGQFAAKECVTLAGPKGSISFVRVLGPERDQTQVEVSKTDSFALGIKVPVRESGDLNRSGSICLLGPKGHVYLDSQVICAQRHIHMDSRDARLLQVTNGQKVSVKTCGERSLIFDEVVVRVKDAFVLEFHIDIDEANAAGLSNSDKVFIVDRH